MAIKIKFDSVHNPELPTMVLMKKSGEKLGLLNPKNVVLKEDLNNPSEISFCVYKYADGKKEELWDKIQDFKLLWCVEWNICFEISVDIEEQNETIKNIHCTELCQAELSQIMLYNIEINTESDIARKDYKNPTILYNFETLSESLLHRIMEKAKHYRVVHVDSTIARIQRTFSFNNISLYDAFNRIAEEIGCIFIFNSSIDEGGNISRSISVYDLESNCIECNHRGQFTGVCPECGSINIKEGYGEDTTIFIDVEQLADNIRLTTDIDSVKNCFKLAGGDDLMTATIRNCNPNGTDYLWYISEETKEDMSEELVRKIEAYDTLYQSYLNNHTYQLDAEILQEYNDLVRKYLVYDDNLEEIPTVINNYPSLMKVYYNTVDLDLYLSSRLMPDAKLSDTSAEKQVELLVPRNISPAATTNISYISVATANSVVMQIAKAVTDSRYKVEIVDSSLTKGTSYCTWVGSFKVTNYSDENDSATGSPVTVIINDDYKRFVEQKLARILHDKETKDLSITGLFNMPFASFKKELQKYCLNSLTSFHDACQACLDILVEQDISNDSTWANQSPNLYDDLYLPYYNMLQAIEAEMKIRENEIAIVCGVKDTEGNIIKKGVQSYVDEFVTQTKDTLDFESYLGETLWKEFITYRREDKFENSNYISDGLNNAELFSRALEFIDVAKKEIYKSAELQHSISSTLINLLAIEKFKPLVEHFCVGNWLRIKIDEKVYKLRLLSYEIDYDNLENINVEFSDVLKTADGFSDQQSLIAKAQNMTSSYSSTQKQASQGADSNKILKGWSQVGLNTATTKIMCEATGQTQSWDEHGMLFRKYDIVTDTYSDIQMKIINSTLALTNNNWKTTKTAIGLFRYLDPETNEMKESYGINGEVILGRILLGEELGIYNESGTLKFNKDGFLITNGVNSFTVNPNDAKKLFALSNQTDDVLYVDEKGLLHIQGDGAGIDISANSAISGLSTKITANAEGLKAEIERANEAEGNLSTRITANADGLSLKVSKNGIISAINASSEKISIEAGKIDLNGAITANGYFKINKDGTMETWAGKIASFIIWDGYLYNGIGIGYDGSCGMSGGTSNGGSDEWIFWAGNGNFRVNKAGDVWLKNAELTGDINANTLRARDYIKMFTAQQSVRTILSMTDSDSSLRNYLLIGEGCTGAAICGTAEFQSTANFRGRAYFTQPITINNNQAIYSRNSSGSSVTLIYQSYSDNIWIGSSTYEPSNCYICAGNVYKQSSGSNTELSDERYKIDVQNIQNAEDFIMALSPKMYRFTDGTSNRYHTGFLAQETKDAMDKTIGDFGVYVRYSFDEETPIDADNPDTYICGLRYNEIIAPHIQTTQNHHKRIADLEEAVEILVNELFEIKEKIYGRKKLCN